MSKSTVKNLRLKEQQIDAESSKQWIRNVGVGTTKVLSKRKSKCDKVSVPITARSKTVTNKPTVLAPTKTKTTTTTTTTATKNESASAWPTGGIQLDVSIDRLDDSVIWMSTAINEPTAVQTSAKSNEAPGTCENDSLIYKTCIESDATLTNHKFKSHYLETIDCKTTNSPKSFSDESSDVSEESSLYEFKSTIDFMNSKVGDPKKLADELSTLKREWNEHIDDAIMHSPLDVTIVNRKLENIEPARAHELSIDLASFDFASSLSASNLYDCKFSDAVTPPLNSTELPSTNTMARIDKALHDMRNINSTES